MGVLERIFKPLSRLIAREVIKEMESIYFPNSEHILEPYGDTEKVLYYIYTHNGSATIEQMRDELGIGERTLRGILKTLMELNIVESSTTLKGKKIFAISDKYIHRIKFKKRKEKSKELTRKEHVHE
jgi:predicted ArsR family transcriptional regulator